MLIYEYKLDGTPQQYAAIDEAVRITQFIRNKCLRKWMDERGISKNDVQCSCAVLATEYPFASLLNSQARQVAADRAWSAIQRFYNKCREHKPDKKGYPQFQRNNRSVEYKQTGWKFDPDGKHIIFTDGCGIGRLRLVGNKKQKVATFSLKQIKRVRMVKRAAPRATPLDRRPLLLSRASGERQAHWMKEEPPRLEAGECQNASRMPLTTYTPAHDSRFLFAYIPY